MILVMSRGSKNQKGQTYDPNEKIKLKMFHAEIQNDTEKPNKEMKGFKNIPEVSAVTSQQVMDNYFQVKLDIQALIEQEVYRLKMEREGHEEI